MEKMRISFSNNKNESIQYDGTAVISLNDTAHQVQTTGSDPTGLGRWSWMLLEGKNNHITRIISAYVPNKSTLDRYHKRYFLSRSVDVCPRTIMYQQ